MVVLKYIYLLQVALPPALIANAIFELQGLPPSGRLSNVNTRNEFEIYLVTFKNQCDI